MLNDTGISKYDRMLWNIYIYKTIWCNHNIIANVHISYDSRIDTYPYSIANSRIAFA